MDLFVQPLNKRKNSYFPDVIILYLNFYEFFLTLSLSLAIEWNPVNTFLRRFSNDIEVYRFSNPIIRF
jgi:hypothetical protein